MKNKRIYIRIDERTAMLLAELSVKTGGSRSSLARAMLVHGIDELIDEKGNWKIRDGKRKPEEG